jgi:imidazole glycerol-phosphate synthase subunit HisF
MRKRLIACIFLKNGMIVRSEDFKKHQVIGNPINQVKRFSDWAVDEIIYLDISKTRNYDNRRDDHMVKISNNKLELLSEISKNIFSPFSFGGGVRTVEDIQNILQRGADKVVLNSGIYLDNTLLPNAVKVFGSQALVACVDYKDDYVYFNHGEIKSQYIVEDWCSLLERNGIGEILLNDILRDGKGCGYDVDTIKKIVDQVSVPVIALGGAGDYYDFNECFKKADPSAVAAGNIFHFKEHSYYYVKKSLEMEGVDIRKEYGIF